MESDLTRASLIPSSDSGKASIVAVNATALYLLAYLAVQSAFQLATVATAAQLGIRGTWQLGRLQFRMADSEWWQAAVLAVYGIGPVVSLGLGIGALWLFWKWARRRRGLLKLFLFWMILHACNLSLGALAADTLTQSGTWFVPSWLFKAGNALNVIVALLAAMLQMVVGYLAAILFLQSHDSITMMQYHNRRRLLVSAVLLPWLVGSAVLLLLHWPTQSLTEQLRYVAMLLLLGPLYMACTNESFEDTIESPSRTRLATGVLLLLSGALLAWRLVLASGISFG
ncbi:hypothetical protein [Hymenobacter sediminicola]|uniref:Uncharacterized protein n=1 Tax=Hymenobacter sediminicola TaxID=2761579 RepID=A0A7G7W2D3_9BACT|nr:hypothetical protein [Hymenobacter sediminicola]QNH60526.1 hypothetical protein H4317_09945 [Hymenobacter sediminicola]